MTHVLVTFPMTQCFWNSELRLLLASTSFRSMYKRLWGILSLLLLMKFSGSCWKSFLRNYIEKPPTIMEILTNAHEFLLFEGNVFFFFEVYNDYLEIIRMFKQIWTSPELSSFRVHMTKLVPVKSSTWQK